MYGRPLFVPRPLGDFNDEELIAERSHVQKKLNNCLESQAKGPLPPHRKLQILEGYNKQIAALDSEIIKRRTQQQTAPKLDKQ